MHAPARPRRPSPPVAALLATCATALATACLGPPVCDAPVAPAPAPSTEVGYLAYGHAHNDYENERPLDDALAAGMRSVEVDVYLDDDEIVAKHDPWNIPQGTLAGLYLDPLQAIVDARATVYDDGPPLTLWIDLKDGGEALTTRLDALLRGYDFLSTFQQGGVIDGAVTVVLTGDAAGKARMTTTDEPRPYARDANDLRADDPPADAAWRYYALSFAAYVGGGDDASARLACLVDRAHADGRALRLFGAPDDEESWALQLAHGVDFVGTDRVDELGSFLAAHTP